MLEERNCLMSTSKHVLKLGYRANAQKIEPSPTFHKVF